MCLVVVCITAARDAFTSIMCSAYSTCPCLPPAPIELQPQSTAAAAAAAVTTVAAAVDCVPTGALRLLPAAAGSCQACSAAWQPCCATSKPAAIKSSSKVDKLQRQHCTAS